VTATVLLPFLPFAQALGLTPLPASYFGAIALIVATQIAAGELTKRVFYRRLAGAVSVSTQAPEIVADPADCDAGIDRHGRDRAVRPRASPGPQQSTDCPRTSESA